MVKETILEKHRLYQCEDCKLSYLDKYYAKKCEEWCKKNKTCNIEITKHAANKEQIKILKYQNDS